MINIQLIPSQHAHFDTFGFLILRQLSSAAEIERYNREFDAGHRAWLGEQSYDGKSRHYTTLMEEYSLFIASLADDGRFVDVAEQLLGKDVVCIVVGANYMVGNTGWHPDTASLDYAAVKFCIYPDPLTATTSALRVLPGSHREPLHSAIERDIEQVYGISSAALPATACESEPSDVVVFNVGTWHVAFGGALGRWQGVLVYYENPPDTPAAITAFVDQMRGNHEFFTSKGQQIYGQYWRSSKDAPHQHWLARLAELDVLETPVEN